jgi:hypothetical protein
MLLQTAIICCIKSVIGYKKGEDSGEDIVYTGF